MEYVTYFKFLKHNNSYMKKYNVNLSVSPYISLLVSYISRKSHYFRNTNKLTGHRDVDALFPYLLTYSMLQSPSWEANWFAVSQEIPRISRNPKVHYRNHKRPPPVSILGQPNPVHIPTSHCLEIHPNIIHPSTPRSPQWSPSLRFPHQDPIYPLSSPICTPCPAHLILLDFITRTILGEEYKSFSSWTHCSLRNTKWTVYTMRLNLVLHSFSYTSLNYMKPATSNIVEASTTSQSQVSMEESVGLSLPASSSLLNKTICNAVFVTIISTFHIFSVTDTWYLSRWIMAECLKT